MPSSLSLIIDITNPTNAGIIQSFQNRLPASVPSFVRNDTESVSLRFVQPSAGTTRPWDDVDYSTATTILALGEFDVVPSSGSNTFQFGPRTACSTTMSSTSVTVTGSTSGIVNGMKVSGSGIPTGTTITISGSTVTLSIAAIATQTGVILYFYNETSGVPVGSTAAVVSTAVNALASVTAAGGVAVALLETGVYQVTLNSTGITPGYFSGNAAGLNPASSVVVSEVVVGAVGIASQQIIEIFVNPYALNSTWTDFPTASGSFVTTSSGSTVTPTGTTVSGSNSITALSSTSGVTAGMSIAGAGIPSGTTILNISGSTLLISQNATASATPVTLTITTPNIQVLTLTAGAYDGSIQISTPQLTTAAIPVPLTGVTAILIQTALNALGASYSVSGNPGGPFAISIAGTTSAYTCNVSGMIVPIGLMGTLNLSTYAMLQKFISSGLSDITLDLEVQVDPISGGQMTPLQLSCTVNKNVINLSNLIPSPTVAYPTFAQLLAIIAGLTNYQSFTTSSTGAFVPTIPQYCKIFTYQGTIGAGSGTFTATVQLFDTDRITGDKTYVILKMPASTNPTILIEDETTASVLYTAVGTGVAFVLKLAFTFNGTAWQSDQ